MNALRQLHLARALAEQDTPPTDHRRFRSLVSPRGPLGGVTAASFLIYRPPAGSSIGVGPFLEQVAPPLLAQLNRSTHPQRIQLRGRARGSVDWAGTIKARAGASQDPTIFVCRQSWRLYDLPENQLLLYVLDGLHQCQRRAPTEMRKWSAWSSDEAGRVGEHLAFADHRLRQFFKSAYLRDVELPVSITGIHEAAARSAKNPAYSQVLDYYHLYRNVIERPSWQQWKEVVGQRVSVLPAADAQVLASIWAAAP